MRAIRKTHFSAEFLLQAFSRFNFRRRQECSTILRWLDARPGETILDVGCGDGYYDSLVSRAGARVLGIDIHKQMLPFAQKYYSGERNEFVLMNAEEMSLPEQSFDKVMSLCVLEHFANDEKVLQHIARVLKPGGRFVFSADSLSNHGIRDAERERHRRRYAVNTFYNVDLISEKLMRTGLAVERTRYVLQTPFALALVRISWKLDDLPKAMAWLSFLGYLGLWGALAISKLFSRKSAAPHAGGLTLLVQAKKSGQAPAQEKN